MRILQVLLLALCASACLAWVGPLSPLIDEPALPVEYPKVEVDLSWLSSFQVTNKVLKFDGAPRQLWGNLAVLENPHSEQEVRSFIHTRLAKALRLNGEEKFVLRKVEEYKKSNSIHFYFDQFLHNRPVFGGELFVHISLKTNSVIGISANVMSARDAVPASSSKFKTEDDMVQIAVAAARKSGLTRVEAVSGAELLYAIDDDDIARLAVHVLVETGADRRPYDVYVDATTGQLIFSLSVWKEALYRQVYDTNHTKELPGELKRVEGQPPTNDQQVTNAYDNAGRCYNFYKAVFGRDSWDGLGSPLNSTVHYSVNYSNAFWNGEQMVYGDGDGVYFSDFTNDLTVICHELTHGVTQSTANLRYFKESGALNEGFSDILGGASGVIWNMNPDYERVDAIADWPIGQNVTLFRFATRWMNNPTLDGSSRDYYPDRYTGLQDEGGVHSNSGIANLAYVLTVQGGVHPEQKTPIWVDPIGLENAQQIYYLTLTQLLTSTSKFVDCRVATVNAAVMLFGDTHTVTSTGDAWTAVGVVEEPNLF